jgi:hypothetical protein
MPVYAVETFKVSDYGGGHQIWFEVEDFDQRDPPGDQYFPLVDEAGAFGQAMTRASGSGGMVRYTFNISAAGGAGGTWYFWGRVINPSNNSDYMLVEGHPGDAQIPTGPPYPGGDGTAPFDNGDDRIFEQDVGSAGNWGWAPGSIEEGHTKELQDGENTMYIFHRQGNDSKIMDVFMWTDDPGYVPTDDDYINALPGKPSGKALRPDPKDGAMISATWVSATWHPGAFAVSHDVYMGENFDDVNDATVDSPAFQFNLTTDNFLAGFFGFPFPDGLVPGTTYYWRVDEVNDADPNSPWKGDVWSFWIPPTNAFDPNPSDGAKYVDLDATLTWQPGLDAKIHNVVFGDNLDDVQNAPAGSSVAGITFTPAALEAGKTYYWRVDELNPPTTVKGDVWSFTTIPEIPISDPSLMGWWKLDEGEGTTAIDWSGHGRHGSFSGDPQWVAGYDGGALEFDGSDHVDTGYTENLAEYTIACWVISPAAPADASPSGPLHREQNYQFNWNHSDATYRGAAAMDVGGWQAASYVPLEANRWYHLAATYDGNVFNAYRDGVLITSNSAPSGAPDAESNSLKLGRHAEAVQFFTGTVDDARVYNRALTAEEVRQVMRGDTTRAWSPSPANGVISDVARAASVSWSAGDSVSEHAVYFGTDADAVARADASDTSGVFRGLQAGTSYTPPEGVLWGGGSYYWRVDEHNTDGTITKGTVWTFLVADYILIDDFESYNDIPAGESGSNLVYVAWVDGFDNPNTNGSTMGYVTGESLETANVHGGSKSVPFAYNNTTAGISEVVRTFTPSQDWTAHGVTTLSLWFHGAPANVAGRLYVKVNGVQVDYDGDSANLSRPLWQVWNIDLASIGTSLGAVRNLAIGIQGPGATGTLLLDDIRLLRSAAEPPVEIFLDAAAANSITPPMKVYNDPLATGGRYIGTDDGIGDENDTAPADGVATYEFTAQEGVYKIMLRVIITGGSNSFWVRIPTATSQTHEDPDQPGAGWIRFNDISDGDTWHWDDVHSSDHNDGVVNITLPAGQHTLEIARREDGALLDAILITSVE